MNKLGNKKVEYDGVVFDSKMERDYYVYLRRLQDAGQIIAIELQPTVELQPKFERGGKKYRAITYKPDFHIHWADGRVEYVDVKGISTQQGELRRKMYLYRYDIPLRWVSASKKYSKTGWIDYDELQRIRRENRKRK